MECPADCDGRFKRRESEGYIVGSYFMSNGALRAFVPFEKGQDDLLVFQVDNPNTISIRKGGYPEVIANVTNTDALESSGFPIYENRIQGQWDGEIEELGSLQLLINANHLSFRYTDAEGIEQTQKDRIQAVFTSIEQEYRDVYLIQLLIDLSAQPQPLLKCLLNYIKFLPV